MVTRPLRSVERFPKSGIGGKIQSTGTVIQDQELRLFHQSPRNGETLSLTAGEIPAVLLQMEIQLHQSVFVNDFFCLGNGQAPPRGLLIRPASSSAPFHVGTDASLEKGCLLGNHADLAAEYTSGIFPDIHTVYQNLSFGSIIEAGDQIYQSGFSASGTSDDADRLTGIYRKADIGKAGSLAVLVAEGHVFKSDCRAVSSDGNRFFLIFHTGTDF